jgi:ATP-dependent Lon protease
MAKLLDNITMPSRSIPLFPLRAVAFPGTALPLHIFEERYKEMIGSAIREDSEFGVVLEGTGGFAEAGCAVKVEKIVRMYPDGRMDILTRGLRRFELLSISDDEPCLKAEVAYFDDEDDEAPPLELKTQLLEQFKELLSIEGSQDRGEPDLTGPRLSFQIAQYVPDPEFQATLLGNRSEKGRLKELAEYLASFIPRRRAAERMKRVTPTNGHGAKPAGL